MPKNQIKTTKVQTRLSKTREKLSKYIPIILSVIFLVSLFRNVYKVVLVKERIKEEEVRVETLRAENEELKRKNAEIQSQEYIEKQLRDKLGLSKTGETVIVLPDEDTLRKLAPVVLDEEDTLPDPTWKKWAHLFGL